MVTTRTLADCVSPQRRRDRRELRAQPGAEAVHGSDNGERDAGGDQAIFNGGRAPAIGEEASNERHGEEPSSGVTIRFWIKNASSLAWSLLTVMF